MRNIFFTRLFPFIRSYLVCVCVSSLLALADDGSVGTVRLRFAVQLHEALDRAARSNERARRGTELELLSGTAPGDGYSEVLKMRPLHLVLLVRAFGSCQDSRLSSSHR